MESAFAEEDVATRDERGAGHGLGRLWIILGLVLVAYPLSVGPAAKLRQRGVMPERVIDTLYGPLEKVCEQVPPLTRFFRWYIDDVWKASM